MFKGHLNRDDVSRLVVVAFIAAKLNLVVVVCSDSSSFYHADS